jgi:type I restriction enzyme S subunit
MSGFKPYPAYRDSGVEWLGKVPEGWKLTVIKYLALLNPNKSGFGGDTAQLCSFVPMEKLKTGTLQLDEQRVIEEIIAAYTYFEDGDLLQAKVTPCFENKNVAIAKSLTNGIGFGSSEINVLRPSQSINVNYLYYLVQEDSYMSYCTSSMIGAGGLKRVPTDVINNFKTAVPELFVQIQIACFLDHETARIDALIEEQQRLIELLKEKRHAVISHAVTKGLDPTIPMKNSGVEWLGEVPAHWEVVGLKRVVVFQRGHDLPADSREEGTVPIISSGGYSGMHKVACAKAPGIVTGRYGSIGHFFLVEQDYWPLNTALYSIELYNNKPRYVWYLLQSYTEHFLLNSLKSAVPGVDRNDVHVVKVVVAPVEDQLKIVDYIDRICMQVDELIHEAKINVSFLRERRSALISVAVTGKIDVRSWQPPANMQAPKPESQEAV